MRIFTAIRHSKDSTQYHRNLWSRNFYPALRELRHQIVESQVDLLPTSRFMEIADQFTPEEIEARRRTTELIVQEVRAAHRQVPIQLFLSYFYNSHFDPDGFDELRRLGVPSINFYCNSIYQFDLVRAVAAKADFSWHAEKSARQAYLDVGARPVWVQMAADPSIYRPIDGLTRLAKACFVGQRYADRDRWMAALIQGGVAVDIFGHGWGPFSESSEGAGSVVGPAAPASSEEDGYLGRRRFRPGSAASYATYFRDVVGRDGFYAGLARGAEQWRYRRTSKRLTPLLRAQARGPVTFDEQVRIYSAYEVSLSFSNVWGDGYPGSPLIPHIRLRDFEAPMCRACYLTGHSDEIGEFYEIGREIDTYRSEEELVDKARFYLHDAEAAERLRAGGFRRARRDHTWVERFRQLFAKVGLPVEGSG